MKSYEIGICENTSFCVPSGPPEKRAISSLFLFNKILNLTMLIKKRKLFASFSLFYMNPSYFFDQ